MGGTLSGAGPASPSSFLQKPQITGTQGDSKTTSPWIHLHLKCGEALTKAVGDLEIPILATLLATTSWKCFMEVASIPWLIFMAPTSKSKGATPVYLNTCRDKCIFSNSNDKKKKI